MINLIRSANQLAGFFVTMSFDRVLGKRFIHD